MNLITKFKLFLEEKNSKKFMRSLLIVLLVGALLLIISSILFDNKDKKDPFIKNNLPDDDLEFKTEDYAEMLEKKLEYILGQISNVGEVNVMITLEDTAEKVPATNTTKNQETSNEEDSQGGSREVLREDSTSQVVTKGGEGTLIVLKEIKPEVKGVIVVADGAEDLQVQEKLYHAVKTVLDIPGNKVEIYSSN
ncbi:MAG TPA: sporulation stage III protein AG [Tissierellales bacterium]|nr:sporulation stage III protein AG [Tissierellales bacterium]